jgi:hypothetical protein
LHVPCLRTLDHEVTLALSVSDNNVELHKAHIRTARLCCEYDRIWIERRSRPIAFLGEEIPK